MHYAWLIITSTLLFVNISSLTFAQENSLAQIINQRSDLSTLAAFFNEVDADFQAALDNDGTYTVFAPNNLAFINLASLLDMPLQDLLEEPDIVTQLLQYHMLEGNFDETAVLDLSGQVMPTVLEDAFISVSTEDDDSLRMNRTAQIIEADIRADNGILHIINEVLLNRVIERALFHTSRSTSIETATAFAREQATNTNVARTLPPPTITPTQGALPSLGEALDERDDLKILLQAFLRLDDGLLEFYNTAPELTFFAPTDQAFINLFASYDLTENSFLRNERLVTEIMLYHTVREALIESEIREFVDESVITVLPPSQGIFVSLTSSDNLLLNNLVRVEETDIEMRNGFVHTINNVLLPRAVLDRLNP